MNESLSIYMCILYHVYILYRHPLYTMYVHYYIHACISYRHIYICIYMRVTFVTMTILCGKSAAANVTINLYHTNRLLNCLSKRALTNIQSALHVVLVDSEGSRFTDITEKLRHRSAMFSCRRVESFNPPPL